jgi:hypothetical protein
MYELTLIERKDMDKFPKVQKFKDHSPLLVGVQLCLWEREGDGKVLVTTRIKSVFNPHENVWTFLTENGSFYELRKV